jgi:CTP-dependent riboflavin kinase
LPKYSIEKKMIILTPGEARDINDQSSAYNNKHTSSSEEGPITVRGRVISGLKESSFFMSLPWVRAQFITKLGIDPYPGTLNLEIVDAEDMSRVREIEKRKAVEIIPAEAGFCGAKCFPSLICGKIKGAIIIPQVSGYPAAKLEIISAERIREVLALKDGDLVQIEIC